MRPTQGGSYLIISVFLEELVADPDGFWVFSALVAGMGQDEVHLVTTRYRIIFIRQQVRVNQSWKQNGWAKVCKHERFLQGFVVAKANTLLILSMFNRKISLLSLFQKSKSYLQVRRCFSTQKQPAKQVSLMMNEKISVMKETLAKTTPRAFSVLFILASIPAFYFINEMLERDYSDAEFVNSSNRFYKYYYFYNLSFFACGIALSRFNFHNPSSKFTIPKTKVKSAIIPFILSFIGLMIPETDNKNLVWPAVVTQLSTLVIEGVMVNKGILPFWFYSYRHYIGLYYFIMFVINYTAMRRLEARRLTHSHEFVEQE